MYAFNTRGRQGYTNAGSVPLHADSAALVLAQPVPVLPSWLVVLFPVVWAVATSSASAASLKAAAPTGSMAVGVGVALAKKLRASGRAVGNITESMCSLASFSNSLQK